MAAPASASSALQLDLQNSTQSATQLASNGCLPWNLCEAAALSVLCSFGLLLRLCNFECFLVLSFCSNLKYMDVHSVICSLRILFRDTVACSATYRGTSVKSEHLLAAFAQTLAADQSACLHCHANNRGCALNLAGSFSKGRTT